MSMENQKYIYIGLASLVALLIIFAGIWFFFLRSSAPAQTNTPDTSFSVPPDTTGATTGTSGTSNNTEPINTPGQVSQTKIFQITGGPVVGATLIQILHPTTTLARYINQEDGHVYDLPLDVPGAVARIVSNVTIPGGARAIWLESGNAAIMQYLDAGVVKSVYLGFPVATTTNAAITLPTRIQFLPDAIEDIAASPDGKSVAYLLTTANGIDGYVAKSDGTGSKKLFSLPLSQILISWPSQGTLMAQTKSAAGVAGIIFSIDAKSGVTTPLVYAPGLTALADATFTHVIYQSVATNATVRLTFVHDVKAGTDRALSFSPFPEKCLWSSVTASAMYCASPLSYVTPDYLDLWHLGTASVADSLFLFNITTGQSTIVAAPGGTDGGVQSDILQMALSPNEHYLLFTNKGDRSVWGVRLTQ